MKNGSYQGKLDKDALINRFKKLKKIVNIDAEDIIDLGDVSLKDSSNLTPENWRTIAEATVNQLNLSKYRGVLITHGTDTMHYTSAALSFMIKNLGKPVVLTGSQIEAFKADGSPEEKSDADKNLYDAAKTAAYSDPGVYIVFASKIFPGTRTIKRSTIDLDAFESPCCTISKVTAIKNVLKKPKAEKAQVDCHVDSNVGLVKVFPGMNPQLIDWYIQHRYKGIIIEGFGGGHVNTDTENLSFLTSLRRAKDAGIPVFMCTQCKCGSVDEAHYEVGKQLEREKLVTGLGDMLPEVAVVKLMCLTGRYPDAQKVKDEMVKNFAGEVTVKS